jgi:hypothetical protein
VFRGGGGGVSGGAVAAREGRGGRHEKRRRSREAKVALKAKAATAGGRLTKKGCLAMTCLLVGLSYNVTELGFLFTA